MAQSASQEYLMDRAKYHAYYDYNLDPRVVHMNDSGQVIDIDKAYKDLSAQKILNEISDSFSVYSIGPHIPPRDAVKQVIVAINSDSKRVIFSDISDMNKIISSLNTKMSNNDISILLCIIMDYSPNVSYIYNNKCSLSKVLNLPYINNLDDRNFEYIIALPKKYRSKRCNNHINVIKHKNGEYLRFVFSYDKENGSLYKVEQTYIKIK